MFKNPWFYVVLVVVLALGAGCTWLFTGDEISVSEVEAMSLTDYQELVKERNHINAKLAKFKEVWESRLEESATGTLDSLSAN